MAKLSNVTQTMDNSPFDEMITASQLHSSQEEFTITSARIANTKKYGRAALFFINLRSDQSNPPITYGLFQSPDNSQRQDILDHFKKSKEYISPVYMVATTSPTSGQEYYLFSEVNQEGFDKLLEERINRQLANQSSSPSSTIPNSEDIPF